MRAVIDGRYLAFETCRKFVVNALRICSTLVINLHTIFVGVTCKMCNLTPEAIIRPERGQDRLIYGYAYKQKVLEINKQETPGRCSKSPQAYT